MKKVKQLYLFKEVESHMRITDKIHVRAHQRRDGSYVREYWRKRPARRSGTRKLITSEEQMSFLEGEKD
ncbi:MAG: hypothetical protein OXU36_10185 [Candidatus Poribacteria bacterium]|nr:hypothetical protein [Candidatus Poribacteria bacterium]